MKKLLFTLLLLSSISLVFGQTADLNGVTFGFGAGYSHTRDKTYDYSLTTDKDHNLKLQPLSKQAFVISSVIMVKLGKIAVDQNANTFVKQSKTADYNSLIQQKYDLDRQNDFLIDSNNPDFVKSNNLDKSAQGLAGVSFWEHLSINLALDLVNVAPDVSFNKNINGGIGIGYFVTENLQVAAFYDVSRISQLRDYIVNSYENKPIPKGDGTNYNALDSKDTNLFYNKTLSGWSFKLIFSLANKKPPQTPPAK
ncbi:hypothetical protein [Mucilaginibacter sp.]|uniref:hypothetical protein n=1 Tax=Mucilaginibacter sp. TaxID=1882438 RepID=UPI002609CED2|nr:hypothetical protein [Mucilaginibacter sp.]MDB4920815.1 hypothetical protein [Mucilaginibacter sp.]